MDKSSKSEVMHALYRVHLYVGVNRGLISEWRLLNGKFKTTKRFLALKSLEFEGPHFVNIVGVL